MSDLKIKKRSTDPKVPIKILFPESEIAVLYTLAAMNKMTVNKFIVALLMHTCKHVTENEPNTITFGR